jgi:hypothetical protein
MAGSHQEDWRELCAAAATEPDSEKLFSLVNQILQAFEDGQNRTDPEKPLESCN